jgi:hypothetical protein
MSSNSCDTMEICLMVELMSSLQKKKRNVYTWIFIMT